MPVECQNLKFKCYFPISLTFHSYGADSIVPFVLQTFRTYGAVINFFISKSFVSLWLKLLLCFWFCSKFPVNILHICIFPACAKALAGRSVLCFSLNYFLNPPLKIPLLFTWQLRFYTVYLYSVFLYSKMGPDYKSFRGSCKNL